MSKHQARPAPTAARLQERYGTWGEHPKYPKSDWQYEVANNDTVLGYWRWVENQIEAEG